MGLNELDSCLKNKEEQEQNERIQQILEMFRKQLNEQTTAEYEEYKAKSRRDPNAFTIMFTDPLDDLDDPDEMNQNRGPQSDIRGGRVHIPQFCGFPAQREQLP